MIAAALFLFTLLCIALSDDRAWDNVTRSARNALVFDGRHQAYGAFALRREYDRRFVLALFLGIGTLGAGVGVARLFASEGTVRITRIIDRELPPLDDIPIVPPSPPAPPTPPSPPAAPSSGTPSIIVIDSTRFARDTASIVPPAPLPGPPGPAPGPGTPVDPGPPGGGPGGPGIAPWDQDSIVETPFVDEPPSYPGGEAAMRKFIRDNVDYPQNDTRLTTIYIAFVVEEDGSVVEVKAKNGQRDFASASERVVRQMPRWSPARINGHPVKCRFILPIRFETK